MERQAKKWAALALVAVLLLGLVGCGGLVERPVSTGSVLLALDNRQAKSLLPPISMDVVEYLVSALGPSGDTYGPELLSGNTLIEELVPGTWSFSVIGRNAAHNDIGAGSGAAAVVIGQTAICSIVVAEYESPDGSFLLQLAWEPDIVDHPSWTGSLKDSADETTAMAFSVNEVACTAQSLAEPLHVGWYTMIVKLFDAPNGPGSEVLSTGAACAVRIAADRQTHGDLFLHAVQGFGMIDLRLDLDFHDPLVLSPNVPFGNAAVYASGDYAFSVTADETCTAVYYLRGQQVATGSYILNAGDLIMDETYRLDVVAFNVDGSRAASGSWNVRHEQFPPGSFDIVGQGTNGLAGSATMLFRLYDPSWNLLALQQIVVPAGSVGNYAFSGLAEGSYGLGMQFQGGSTWFWVGPLVKSWTTAEATLVVVPGEPPSAHVCDFGVMVN